MAACDHHPSCCFSLRIDQYYNRAGFPRIGLTRTMFPMLYSLPSQEAVPRSFWMPCLGGCRGRVRLVKCESTTSCSASSVPGKACHDSGRRRKRSFPAYVLSEYLLSSRPGSLANLSDGVRSPPVAGDRRIQWATFVKAATGRRGISALHGALSLFRGQFIASRSRS